MRWLYSSYVVVVLKMCCGKAGIFQTCGNAKLHHLSSGRIKNKLVRCGQGEPTMHRERSRLRTGDDGNGLKSTQSLNNDDTKSAAAVFRSPVETSAGLDNVPVDSSEKSVNNSSAVDMCTTVAPCLINWSVSCNDMIEPEEETGRNSNFDFDIQRTSQKSTGFTLNEDSPSRNARAFISNNDWTHPDHSLFGIPRDNGSVKPILVDNSELQRPYCESDQPHKAQDLALPYPIARVNTVAGNNYHYETRKCTCFRKPLALHWGKGCTHKVIYLYGIKIMVIKILWFGLHNLQKLR